MAELVRNVQPCHNARQPVKQLNTLGLSVVVTLGAVSARAAEQILGQPAQPLSGFTLSAAVQEQLGEGHTRARGYVVIQAGAIGLQADTVDFWNIDMKVAAEGNVVFQQGSQKIVASKMTMDLRKGTGEFWNAYGTAADFYFYGEHLEKLSEEVYVIHRGAFSPCSQPNPRWRFTAGKARIRVEHNLLLHNVFLKVKSIPVFFLPILYYPINADGRGTGFLLPEIGTSTTRGFLVSESFFWAINRSMDSTLTYDHYSLAGNGFGGEYRYAFSDLSRGTFRSYFIQDKVTSQQQYTLDYTLTQNLPGRFKATALVDYFSSFDFQQQFQDNLNAATQRSKRASVNVNRVWSSYNFRVLFDRNETSFSNTTSLRQALPLAVLSARPTRLLGTPLLWSFQGEASRLTRTQTNVPFEYARFDLFPTLSYPFTKLSYLTFRTSVSSRYTHYTGRLDRGRFPSDEPIDRRYYEFTVDARGPTFARIFDTPDNFYAERYKHVIEPQIIYSYRPYIDVFDLLPKYDGNDYIPGTNQLSFSLVNRFFGKRKTRAGALSTPVEFLTWTLSQRYFFDTTASLYDPQYSGAAFSPDGTPSVYSPVSSRLRFRPNSTLMAQWDTEYDVNFGVLRSMSLLGTLNSSKRGSATGAWTRRAVSETDVRNNVRGTTRLTLGRVEVGYDMSYDVSNRVLQYTRANFVYSVQCCGFLAEYQRYRFSSLRNEGVFRFGVTLAGVGTFGNFLGQPGATGRVQ